MLYSHSARAKFKSRRNDNKSIVCMYAYVCFGLSKGDNDLRIWQRGACSRYNNWQRCWWNMHTSRQVLVYISLWGVDKLSPLCVMEQHVVRRFGPIWRSSSQFISEPIPGNRSRFPGIRFFHPETVARLTRVSFINSRHLTPINPQRRVTRGTHLHPLGSERAWNRFLSKILSFYYYYHWFCVCLIFDWIIATIGRCPSTSCVGLPREFSALLPAQRVILFLI